MRRNSLPSIVFLKTSVKMRSVTSAGRLGRRELLTLYRVDLTIPKLGSDDDASTVAAAFGNSSLNVII